MATHKAKKLYRELKERYPELDKILLNLFFCKMPEEAIVTLLFLENEMNNDRHIRTKEQFDEAVEHLEWFDKKNTGAKWSVDSIISNMNNRSRLENSGITKYDYAYIVNSLYADFGKASPEQSYYLRMADSFLENNNYKRGRPSERAYNEARERIRESYRRNYKDPYYHHDDGYEDEDYKKREHRFGF